MKFKQFLEMPIDNAELIGKGWDKFGKGKVHQGWDKASYNIMNNGGIQRISKKWENTPYDFDMYFVKDAGLSGTFLMGQVDQQKLQQIGLDIPINPNNITIIYTNNRGGERIPMTPWIVAHRFSHAIERTKYAQYFQKELFMYLSDLTERVYGNKPTDQYTDRDVMKKIAEALGTMRSARSGKLANIQEFYHEVVAQFLIDGKIVFNKKLPKSITLKKAWGKPVSGLVSQVRDEDVLHQEQIADFIEMMENTFEHECINLLSFSVGKIFVI